MKPNNLIFVISICILLFGVCKAQWVQIVPSGGDVHSIAANDSTVFAGLGDGVYLSTDNGQTWAQTSLDSLYCGPLAVSDSNIFVAGFIPSQDLCIYHSTNNGRDWELSRNMGIFAARSLAVSGSNIFAGLIDIYGLFGQYLDRSIDNGQNWTTLNEWYVYLLAVSASNVFTVASDPYNVKRSTDNGETWAQTSLISPWISSLAVSGSNVFAGSWGVYCSTDNGETWAQTSLTNQTVLSLAVSDLNVFAGTENSGVYYSSNLGETWNEINNGLGNLNIISLVVGTDYIYALSEGELAWRRPLSEIITSVEEQKGKLPDNFILEQNFPNPFNPSTTIRYSIPTSDFVTLKVYDVLGNEVATLVNEEKPAGSYEVNFNASQLSSGIYFYKLQAGSFVETKKMILLR